MPHDHPHDPGHGHAHGHGHARDAAHGPERRLWLALALTGGFMLAEVVGGILSGSLALIADAGHMLTDGAALALALGGIRLGRRRADTRRSYGYRRLEVLASFVNGVALVVLTLWILVEAVQRIADPVAVLGGPMLVIATLGLAVNIAAFLILHRRGGEQPIALSGALAHVVGDLLGSLAAIAAALVIRTTGWMPIDPLLSVLVALLILRSGWIILRRSGHILLEGTPSGLDPGAITRDLETLAGVGRAHHLHVWSLTSGAPLATLHVRPAAGADARAVLHGVKDRLRTGYGITHSTVEIDFDGREAAPPVPAPDAGHEDGSGVRPSPHAAGWR